MLRTFIAVSALVALPAVALADMSGGTMTNNGQGADNRSCVATATQNFKDKDLRGNNGNGVGVREQAREGVRGEMVQALLATCDRGSMQAP